MIKMKVSFYSISLIFMCSVSMINSQNETQTASPSKDLGPISCYYFGSLDSDCGLPVVPVKNLPKECMAYFFSGLTVDLTYDVLIDGTKHDEEFLDDLLLHGGKPVYVKYSHYSFGKWTQIFGCDACTETNAKDEMKGLQAYFDKHKGIAGLVLTDLIPSVRDDKTVFPKFSECLKIYINVIKSTFPDVHVGLSFLASFFVDYYNNPLASWLDFAVINEVVDLYEIDTNCLNYCSSELRTGIAPINGKAEYTLEKVDQYLQQAKIPKEKIYFKFQLNAATADPDLDTCLLSYQEICVDPKLAKDWCSDTQATLYEKGVFAREKGKGVIAAFVDYDDSNNCCKCSKAFAGFQAIVDGFNCAEPPKPCALFDRSHG